MEARRARDRARRGFARPAKDGPRGGGVRSDRQLDRPSAGGVQIKWAEVLQWIRRMRLPKLHVAGVAHGTDSCKACDALFRLYAAAARAQNR